MRDEALFCQSCGKKVSGKLVLRLTKKSLLAILGVVLSIILLIALFNAMGAKPSIVGTWESADGREISFSKSGKFEYGAYYGTYTIYENQKLSLTFQDWDRLGDTRSYDWSEDAMVDAEYWYISGKTLYFQGKSYTKK